MILYLGILIWAIGVVEFLKQYITSIYKHGFNIKAINKVNLEKAYISIALIWLGIIVMYFNA